MTALCGGGASRRRGSAIVQYVGPAALGAMLNNIPTPWAVAFAAYVGLITYDLHRSVQQTHPRILGWGGTSPIL